MRVATQGLAVILAFRHGAAPRRCGAETVWLSSLDLSKMEQGWGRPQIDRSISETPLSFGGNNSPTASAPMLRASSGSTWAAAVTASSPRWASTRRRRGPMTSPSISRARQDVVDWGVMEKAAAQDSGHRHQRPQDARPECGPRGGGIDFAHGDWADARFLISGVKPRTIEPRREVDPERHLRPRRASTAKRSSRPSRLALLHHSGDRQRPMTFAVKTWAGSQRRPPEGYITGKLADVSTRWSSNLQRPGHGPAQLQARLRRHLTRRRR